MDASVFGTPDPAIKDDRQPSILRQFEDFHLFILKSREPGDFSPIPYVASRQARMAGMSVFGGKTFHDPSSCRKKTIAKHPSRRNAPTRT
jgi:hypothetical protein